MIMVSLVLYWFSGLQEILILLNTVSCVGSNVLVIHAGANVLKPDEDGATLLSLLATSDTEDIIWFLDFVKEHYPEDLYQYVNRKNHEGHSALSDAMHANDASFKAISSLTNLENHIVAFENHIVAFYVGCKVALLPSIECFPLDKISDSELLKGIQKAAEYAKNPENDEDEQEEGMEVHNFLVKEGVKRGLRSKPLTKQ
jgi:hypothetical protein